MGSAQKVKFGTAWHVDGTEFGRYPARQFYSVSHHFKDAVLFSVAFQTASFQTTSVWCRASFLAGCPRPWAQARLQADTVQKLKHVWSLFTALYDAVSQIFTKVEVVRAVLAMPN